MAASRRENVLDRLRSVPSSNQWLTPDDFTQTGNTVNELSKIAEYQTEQPIAVRGGVAADVHMVAYEEFTTDGTASNTETFNLSHDIVDAASVADDFLLYEGGTEQSADSVDYAANSFDYTDDGTANTLHAYYIVGDQALLQFRKTAPKSHWDELKELDAGIVNLREQTRDPITFDFRDPLDGVIPTDWKLEVYINAPYTVQWEDDTDSAATADNLMLSVPIRRATEEIPGLSEAVTQAI